jgi:hypothetical protein
MKTKIFLVLMLITSMCQAQTKVISHKSHSGSKRTFSGAYQKSLFDMRASNFGGPRMINVIVLDSVVAVNDSVTVLKMRESNLCFEFRVNYKDLKDSDFHKRSETVVSHPILNKKNTVAHIHSSRGQLFWFDNPIESVVFVGFKK